MKTRPSPGAPRTALVSGGSRGIGAAIVEQLGQAGFQVATLDRTAVPRPGVLALAGSVSDAAAVDAAFSAVEAEFGPVGVVVANAGVTHDTLLARMDDHAWEEVLATNLTGAYRLARRAVRGMLTLGWGRFVFTGSVVGLAGAAGQANYAASKAGLVGLARSLAKELGPRGITANVVAPGWVETAMTAGLGDQAAAQVLPRIPLRRVGQPAEVAAAVRFLCSDDAAYVTGAVLPVDGGLSLA